MSASQSIGGDARVVDETSRRDHKIRHISVISPMRNEGEHIEEMIADVAAQDFDGKVSVFIADGRSTDDSISRATGAARRYGVSLEVVDNPEQWVSRGLNECIRHADGDLIVRLDCHSRYPSDYLRRCAAASEETEAEVVGGVFVPRGDTPHERAVACAMASAFGGIHWMRNTSDSARREADIAIYGAFRPEAFELAGLFDTSFVRNQDDEFTLRLRQLGGRVVLDPSIHVYYKPRSTFRGVFRQYFEYGLWKIPVMVQHRRVLTLRSLAPIGFVASILLLALLAPWLPVARWLLAGEIVAYLAGAVCSAALAVRRRDEMWRMLPRVVAVFATFHVAYGLGMLTGVARAFRRDRRRS